MKEIRLVVAFLIVVVLMAVVFAPAADKFKLEIGPNFVGHRTTFYYPDDPDSRFVSGTSFSGTGLHASGSAKLSGIVNIGARFDHNFLSNPTFFEVTRRGERNDPSYNEQRGSSQQAEGFLDFRVWKIGTLEAGVARHYFGRHWVYSSPCVQNSPCRAGEINSYHDAISWGAVMGLTREVNLGNFTLGGGIWGYPRMSQNQEWSNDQGGTWKQRSEIASGIKLEATGGYKLTPHTTVKGGYQFFRMATPDSVQIPGSWRIDTTRVEHAVIARYSVHF